MMRVFLKFSFYSLLLLPLCAAFSEQVEVPSPRESVRLRPLQEQKISRYQHQDYQSKKLVEVKNLSSQPFSSSVVSSASYTTRSFLGIKNDFIGKKIFVGTAVSSFSAKKHEGEGKIFSTKAFSTAAYSLAEKHDHRNDKKILGKQLRLDPKAQGALDHDSLLQQISKKNLSVDEVKAILDEKI